MEAGIMANPTGPAVNPIAYISQKLAARRYRKATGMDRPIEELARESRERCRENALARLVTPDERMGGGA